MRQTQEKTKCRVFFNAFTGDTFFLSKVEVSLLDKGERAGKSSRTFHKRISQQPVTFRFYKQDSGKGTR